MIRICHSVKAGLLEIMHIQPLKVGIIFNNGYNYNFFSFISFDEKWKKIRISKEICFEYVINMFYYVLDNCMYLV